MMPVYAKYDGIEGEVHEKEHHKWIEVMSAGWGAAHPDGSALTSRRSGGADVDDLVLVIGYDKGAVALQQRCLSGKPIAKLDVDFTSTAYGNFPQTYLRYELKNVMIKSFEFEGVAEDKLGPPTMVVANSFEEIKVIYTEFEPDGKKRGTTEATYHVEYGR